MLFYCSRTRNNESNRVGQFLLTWLGTKTRTRNRETNSLELELELDLDKQFGTTRFQTTNASW